MKLRTALFVVQQLLLTVLIITAQVEPKKNGTLFAIAYKCNNGNVNKCYLSPSPYSDKLLTAFRQNGPYTPRGQFILSPYGNHKNAFNIRIFGEENIIHEYLQMSVNHGKLISHPSPEGAVFQLLPLTDSESNFNILRMPSNEFLVTPNSIDAFRFSLKSRYPAEPPAEFYIERLNISQSYDGTRKNILPLLQLIRKGEFDESRTDAYKSLLDLMGIFGHIGGGKEIFDVAQFIKEDLGEEHPVFQELPSQVKLLIDGGPLRLFNVHIVRNSTTDQNSTLPMKYNYASEGVEKFEPYTFTYSNGLWSITYAGLHQLTVSAKEYNPLEEEFLFSKKFEFLINLSTDVEGFSVFSKKRTGFYSPLVSVSGVAGNIYFSEAYGYHPLDYVRKSVFTVKRYD